MPPQTQKSGYLPSLDGWRAIAICGVLLVHDFAHQIGPIDTTRFRDFGHYGVHLFFALSGLLICTRLLEEESLTGRIHLKSFYIRRIFRIEPAALTYLLAAAIAAWVGLKHEPFRYWISCVFSYRNSFPHDDSGHVYFALGHFWTLSVEEQFYVFLSLLLVTLRRRALWMGTLTVLTSAWMWIVPHIPALTSPVMTYRTDWNVHYLLWPATLAVLLRRPDFRSWVLRWLNPWTVFLATFLLLLANHSFCAFVLYPGHGFMPAKSKFFDTDIELILMSFPFWIMASMLHPMSWTTRLLETAPLRFVGRLSYSLYLWHVVFFLVRFGIDNPHHNNLPIRLSYYPWNILASFACAMASYYLIEKPCMRLGHRLAPPATAGRPELMDLPSMASSAQTSRA